MATLDALASEQGQSRAAIARLVNDQRQMARTEPESKGYGWRKAKRSDTFDWFVVVDGEPVAGVKKDNVNGWRGKHLNGSWVSHWAKRKTRDKVARELFDAPDIYR